jgi:SAM-dependent methyltransferase
MPLAGNFLLKKEVGGESDYPLKVYRCNNCSLVQLLVVVSPEKLFKDYRYISSIPLNDHFEKFARKVTNKFKLKDKKILEIGSNDGVFLNHLNNLGVKVLGIDPAENIAKIANNKGLTTIVDYFSIITSRKIKKKYGTFDAIFASNVLAHIDDIAGVYRGIDALLAENGILVIEVHYLLDLIRTHQYDFIYHEHLIYYTLKPLIKFLKTTDMEIFDVEHTKLHSGSLRIFLKKKNNQMLKKTQRYKNFVNVENTSLKGNSEYKSFNKFLIRHKEEVIELFKNFQLKQKKVVGYGASGRANTFLNYVGLTTKDIAYIIDESPERYGRYTPGTHIRIVPPDFLENDKIPDYIFILAWNYSQKIMNKQKKFSQKGGKFIIPLPKLKIINEQI